MSNHSMYAGAVELPIPTQFNDRSIYTFVSEQPGFNPNLIVAREKREKDLTEYAKDQLDSMKRQFPDLEVDEKKEHQLSGKRALTRAVHFTVSAQKVKQLQVCVQTKQWFYTLTFSSTPDRFAKDRPHFDQMIAATKLRD